MKLVDFLRLVSPETNLDVYEIANRDGGSNSIYLGSRKYIEESTVWETNMNRNVRLTTVPASDATLYILLA